MGTLQRIDWLAGIKRLNPGALKGYEPFFHGSSQSQAAHTSSYLNGLDVVVNYNYERVARAVDVVSGSIGQRSYPDLDRLDVSSLGVFCRAGAFHLELLLFDWLAGRSISPNGSCSNGDVVRNIPMLVRRRTYSC